MRSVLVTGIAFLTAVSALALQPPRRGELKTLGIRGDLSDRIAFATRLGNHRLELAAPGIKVEGAGGLPTTGIVRVLALLVDFPDSPHTISAAVVDAMLFGSGNPANFPKNSLRQFYLRSSYGKLDIQGSTLGWYTAKNPRNSYTNRGGVLIREILDHFDRGGHDFTVYDNDGNGEIDSLNIFWTGEVGEWATFWWGSTWGFLAAGGDPAFRVDGKAPGKYTWQPENDNPACVIHETGHILGLPDYYDYDGEVGPKGGIGNMDVMAGDRGDHNGYSKWVLGWLTPQLVTAASPTGLTLPAAGTSAAGAVVVGAKDGSPNGEYFLVQNRACVGNDSNMPGDGVLIFHVDARVGCDGVTPMFNNATTEHKLLRLIEADVADDIERWHPGDANDYFKGGGKDSFGPFTSPASDRCDGSTSGVLVDTISQPGAVMTAVARVLGLGTASMPEVTSPASGSDTAGLTPRISWRPVPGAGGYQIELHSAMNRLYRAMIPAGASTHDIAPGVLVNEGTYALWIRALGNGSSLGAGPFRRRTFSTRPCAPARWVVRTFADLCCSVTLDNPGIAFDPVSGVTVQFGGAISNATYEYDGTRWQAFQTNPAPEPRRYSVLVPDPTGGGILLFGGLRQPDNTVLNDTWRYDPAMGRWQQLACRTSPPGSWTWKAAADSSRGVIVLVSYLGTWEWNGTTWRDLGQATGTPPLYATSISYDGQRQRVVMFGGRQLSNDDLTDATWEFAGSQWKKAVPGERPPARSDSAMVYQQKAGVTLLFGGWAAGGRLSDLWAWDGKSWTSVPVCDSQGPERWTNYAVYDSIRDVIVTGGLGGWLSTWELEVEGPLSFHSVRRRIGH